MVTKTSMCFMCYTGPTLKLFILTCTLVQYTKLCVLLLIAVYSIFNCHCKLVHKLTSITANSHSFVSNFLSFCPCKIINKVSVGMPTHYSEPVLRYLCASQVLSYGRASNLQEAVPHLTGALSPVM